MRRLDIFYEPPCINPRQPGFWAFAVRFRDSIWADFDSNAGIGKTVLDFAELSEVF